MSFLIALHLACFISAVFVCVRRDAGHKEGMFALAALCTHN